MESAPQAVRTCEECGDQFDRLGSRRRFCEACRPPVRPRTGRRRGPRGPRRRPMSCKDEDCCNLWPFGGHYCSERCKSRSKFRRQRATRFGKSWPCVRCGATIKHEGTSPRKYCVECNPPTLKRRCGGCGEAFKTKLDTNLCRRCRPRSSGRRRPGSNGGRKGPVWDKLRAQVLAEEDRCWVCGQWVDTDRPYRDPLGRVDVKSPAVDHVLAVAEGGPLFDRSNVRLAHLKCNARRGGELSDALHLGADLDYSSWSREQLIARLVQLDRVLFEGLRP